MMEHSHTIRNLVLLKFLHGFFLLVLCMMSTCPESAAFPSPTLLGNESDRLALLDFKKRITEDPLSVMSSWNHSIHFCSWGGITCHRATQRVLILDLEDKQLVGSIPPSIGNLTRLTEINLGINKFHGEIPQELGRLRTLEIPSLSDNSLGGKIPTNMSHCTQVRFFDLSSNKIIGSIPRQLSSWLSLTVLQLGTNNLSGTIPGWIGNFSSLTSLNLASNNFQGSIPNELGHITTLEIFSVEENNLSGNIPVSLSNASRLEKIDFASNDYTGSIPQKLMELSTLSISLDLSYNYLTGSLPSEVGDLVHLTRLVVSNNNLSGDIPSTLGSCASLGRLYLDDNRFEGTLPQSLKDLKGLEELDISSNNLSGQIPEFIGKLGALKYLNLSYNDFEGKLPKEGIFSNVSGVSVLGNHRLCGGIPQLHLLACPKNKHHSSRGLLSPKVVIPISCALAFIIALSCFFGARSMLKKSRDGLVTSHSYKDWKLGVSYSQLVESTNGFSMDNLIGSGSFGSVYKGVIPSDGTVVAVKVLNLQQQGASKSFNDECKALRSVRHRNLVKIITACSSIDNHGRDFKSLVFEFMPNGSLDSWLHPRDEEQSPSKRLNFMQRLNIVIDVASALDYLHNHCETSIVHCDLKPSNVLLDEDMVAHVGDFGLARFLLGASNDPSLSQTMSLQLKGSVGYIPPEYGMGGQVSILGDVYSYGILLLEMFTGKTPIDDMFIEGLSIYKFTTMALPDHVMDIVDPSLLIDLKADRSVKDDRNERIALPRRNNHGVVKAKKVEECLFAVMQIGLSCCAVSPKERMLLNMVVGKMSAIRDLYLKVQEG